MNESEKETVASESREAKPKARFRNVSRYLVPLLVVAVALGLWQVWGRQKPPPKGQRTLLTSPRLPTPPLPPPQPAAEPEPPPKTLTEAEEILLKCASTYAQANSWRAIFSLDSVSKAGSTELPQSVFVHVAVKKPNKYSQVSQGSGLMGISLNSSTVSDGVNIYTYVESLAQALRAPAPQTLAELARFLSPEMPAQVSEPSLMAGVDPLQQVQTVTLAGSEEVNGHKCHVLDLTFEPDALAAPVQGLLRKQEQAKQPPKDLPFRSTSGSQRLWIDAHDFLIRKQQLQMNMDVRSAAGKIFGEQALSLVLPEALEKTVVQTYSEVHLDETLPDSWFAFTPPQGVKVVEHLDFGALLDEMLGLQ